MQARWSTGIWLGKLWRSDDHVLAVDEKVIRARAIRTQPDDESWAHEVVAKIVATPWNFNRKEEEQEGAAPKPRVEVRPVGGEDHEG